MPGRCSHLPKTITLANREREVCGLLADGMSTKAIAQLLDISPGTVRSTIENSIQKLSWRGVFSRRQLVRWVEQQRKAAA